MRIISHDVRGKKRKFAPVHENKIPEKKLFSHSTNIPIHFKYCSPLHLKNSDKSRRNARGNCSYDTSKIASNLQANKLLFY